MNKWYIRLIGLSVFVVGVALAYGTLKGLNYRHFPTITLATLPALQIVAGLSLLRGKDSGRHLTFSVCFSYVLLGIFSTVDLINLFDYLAVAPLVEYIPMWLFHMDLKFLSPLCLFGFPILMSIFVNLKSVANTCNPKLAGKWRWSVPLSVVLVSVFIFSYRLFTNVEIEFLTQPSQKIFFGFPPSEELSRAIFCLWYALYFIAAFAVYSGDKFAGLMVIVFAAVHWYPYVFGRFSRSFIEDIRFMTFGVGWMAASAIVLFNTPFYWNRKAWLAKRGVPQPVVVKVKVPLSVVENAPETRTVEKKPRNLVVPILLSIVVLAGGLIYYLFRDTIVMTPQNEVAEAQVVEEVPTFPIQLEGTTVDASAALAIVNGNVYQVGDTVAGYRIEEIRANRILISRDSKRQWLDGEGNLF